MKILILGGTGLISSAITAQLLQRGEDVTLYNRGRTEARIPGGAKVVLGDRKNVNLFETQIRELGAFDCVIDMIAFTPEDAESAVRAFQGRVEQYLFCSTVCVYGGPADHYPIHEDEPRRPVGGYGANKVRCEDIFMEANKRGDFAVTILRPSQTYGEGGTIVHSLGGSSTYLDRIRKGKPIVVHGDGSCLWAACHIDDVAAGFIGAIGNPIAYGRPYNLTGEEWMTWNKYHEGVALAMGAPKPDLVHIPTDLLAQAAPKHAGISVEIFQYPSVFDNTAAIRDLGFSYNIHWIEGVRRTVAWLEERGRIENSDNDTFEDALIEAWRTLQTRMNDELRGKDG